jgi:hypothetical protein
MSGEEGVAKYATHPLPSAGKDSVRQIGTSVMEVRCSFSGQVLAEYERPAFAACVWHPPLADGLLESRIA